jgi:hypothetical protein
VTVEELLRATLRRVNERFDRLEKYSVLADCRCELPNICADNR